MSEEKSLSLDQVLEMVIAFVTVIGPLVGVMWYAETRINDLDRRQTQIEYTLNCLVNTMINDVKPTYCLGE